MEMDPVPYVGDHCCVDPLPLFLINRGGNGCGLVVEASGMRSCLHFSAIVGENVFCPQLVQQESIEEKEYGYMGKEEEEQG